MSSSNYPRAYLDIETTGLDPSCADITVIGIYIEDGSGEKIVQLVGSEIQDSKVLETFKGLKKFFTYNGSKFDIPFIEAKLGINLERLSPHTDLMHICWQYNLYGGFKEVERRLGIKRELSINGKEAVALWYNYINGDKTALNTLLRYNREDLTNLKLLREKLLEIKNHREECNTN